MIALSLDIPGGNGNGYDLGDVVALRGGSGFAFTYLIWHKPNSVGANRRLIYKSGVIGTASIFGNTDDIEFSVSRATTLAILTTSSGPLAADGDWKLIVFTYDETDGPRVFHGTDTTPVVEATYGSGPTVGAGATISNTNAITLYYRAGSNRTLDGPVAYSQLLTQRLTLGQILGFQFGPVSSVANTQGLYFPGTGAVGTLIDYSGNGNNATQAGSGQAIVNDAPSVGTVGTYSFPFSVVAAAGPTAPFPPWPRPENIALRL